MAPANGPSSSSAKGSAWEADSLLGFGGLTSHLASKRKVTEDEAPQEERYWKVMTDLPEELRYIGDGEGAYVQHIEADTEKKFGLRVIHSGSDGHLGAYRKMDAPKHMTGGYVDGKPKGKKYCEQEMPVKVFVLDSDTDQALASAGYCQQEWDATKFEVNPKDFELEFRGSTQRPMIRLHIILERVKVIQDNKPVYRPTKTVVWECSATCLQKSATQIGVTFKRASQQDLGMSGRQEALNDPIFKANFDAGTLLSVDVKLDRTAKDQPRFTGIAEDKVKGFSDQIKSGNIPVDPREKMLGYLYDATSLRFVTKDPSQEQKHLDAFSHYFRTICYVTAHEGTHWYYKLAAHASDLRMPSYPFGEVEPPRWSVTHWLVEVLEKDGQTTHLSADPREWKAFPRVDAPIYPSADTFGFELRLATARDDKVSGDSMDQLLSGNPNIVAHFTRSPADDRQFLVEMTLKGNSQDASMLQKVPLYTRIRIEANMSGTTCLFVGKTCDDLRATGPDLAATATLVTTDVPPINLSEPYLVSVQFPVDHTAANRVLNSISSLQNGHNRLEGIDFRELALAAPPRAKQQPEWLSKYFAENSEAKKRYEAEISRHGKLNEGQLEAAWASFKPSKGATLIWGPPGTGKTYTLMAIAKALLCAGFTIVCTSTSNPAVNNMMVVFEADPPQNMPDGKTWDKKWSLRFSGTLKHTDIKDKTVEEDSMEVDQLNEESQYSDEVDDERLAGLFEMLVGQAVGGSANSISDRGLAARKASWIETVAESAPLRESYGLGSEIPTLEEQEQQKANPVDEDGNHNMPDADEDDTIADADEDETIADADEDDTIADAAELAKKTDAATADKAEKPSYSATVKNATEPSESDKAAADAKAADKQRRITQFRAAELLHRDAKAYLQAVNRLKSGKLVARKRKEVSKEFRQLEGMFNDHYLKNVAKIVFVTNNSSQDDALASFRADAMVSDECGQASPGDSITGWARFKETVKHLVMGGDHKQLSPVVLSGGRSEVHTILARSIFAIHVQHPELGYPTIMLKTQYRMHKDIVEFINSFVYDGLLETPDSVSVDDDLDKNIINELEPLRKGQQHWNGRRVIAIDCCGTDEYGHKFLSETPANSKSSVNVAEAWLVIDQARWLIHQCKVPVEEIAVLCPYNDQMATVDRLMYEVVKEAPELRKIKKMSADSSQGQEAKVVILSLTKNVQGEPDRIGFLVDMKRLNVALSRAKSWLIINGNFKGWSACIKSRQGMIATNGDAKMFREMVKHLQSTKAIIPYKVFFDALAQRDVQDRTPLDYSKVLAIAPRPQNDPHAQDDHKPKYTSFRAKGGMEVRNETSIGELLEKKMAEQNKKAAEQNKKAKTADDNTSAAVNDDDLVPNSGGGGRGRGRGRGGRGGGGRGGGGRGGGGRGGRGRGDRGRGRG